MARKRMGPPLISNVPSCRLVTGQSSKVDQNAKTTNLSAFYSSQGKAENSQILLNV